jgi:hypothetical protein
MRFRLDTILRNTVSFPIPNAFWSPLWCPFYNFFWSSNLCIFVFGSQLIMMLKAVNVLRALQYGDPRGITAEVDTHTLVLLIKLLTCCLSWYECISIFFFTFMWPCIVTDFFIIKLTRCTNFTNLFCHETSCFGHFVCSSSGVYSLYTQQWYMPYRFVDGFRAVSG